MTADFPIPAGYALVPLEPTEAMVEAAKDERMACFKDTALSVGAALARIYKAAVAAAPPIAATGEDLKIYQAIADNYHATAAVVGEPVAESASAFKSRLITDACSKWSGAQKVEAGDIVEWIADYRVAPSPATDPAATLIEALLAVQMSAVAIPDVAGEHAIKTATLAKVERALGAYSLSVPAKDRKRLPVTVCCGRSECGGECGNEWAGMEDVSEPLAAVVGVEASPEPLIEPVTIAKAMRAHRQAEVWLNGGTGPVCCVALVNIQIEPWNRHTPKEAQAFADGFNLAAKWMRNAIATPSQALPVAAGEAVAWQWRKRHTWFAGKPDEASFWSEWEPLVPPCMDARELAVSDPKNYELRPLYAGSPPTAREPQIGAMVDRFLAWKLPADFSPDCGISFKRVYNESSPFGPRNHEPIGANLLTKDQARAMLEHVLGIVAAATGGDRG